MLFLQQTLLMRLINIDQEVPIISSVTIGHKINSTNEAILVLPQLGIHLDYCLIKTYLFLCFHLGMS